MKECKIYLAGQMTGLTFEESNLWRTKAKTYLESLENNILVEAINPNDYFNFKDMNYESDKEIIRFDLMKVRTSNLILVNLNGFSIGTAMELQHAYDNLIPILGYCHNKEDVHPWEEFVCDRVFRCLDEALEYIKNYYLN